MRPVAVAMPCGNIRPFTQGKPDKPGSKVATVLKTIMASVSF